MVCGGIDHKFQGKVQNQKKIRNVIKGKEIFKKIYVSAHFFLNNRKICMNTKHDQTQKFLNIYCKYYCNTIPTFTN